MSATSTKLPKLERLLLDGDINAELEPLLRAVGFRTESAYRIDANIRSDTALIRWARRNRYIFVCHDRLRDRKTNQYVYPEIYHYGGKVIRIGGDSSQGPLTALGKIVLHREKWREFFAEHDGIVVVHGTGVNLKEASELYRYVQGEMGLVEDPAGTLRKRGPPRRGAQKRRRATRASARLL
jgi:hypothetical protein